MSSWLSSNLTGSLSSISNLTGQISSFTREILTEGAEEVSDPSAELLVAQARINELEAHLLTQKAEYERVKHNNDELHVRLEASELQINNISKEYRAQLHNKERELIQLRELSRFHEVDGHSFGGRERHDSTDSIEDSMETKRLRSEISKLQAECEHWKSVAHGAENQDKLHKEIDQYQHELTALQSSYSQKISTLNKRHKQELQKWQGEKEEYAQRIEELEEQLLQQEQHGTEVSNHADIADSHIDKNVTLSLKKQLVGAEKTIEQLKSQVKQHEDRVEALNVELQEKKDTINALEKDLNDAQAKYDESIKTHAEVTSASENNLNVSKKQIEKLQTQLEDQSKELSVLSHDSESLKMLQEQFHVVATENAELKAQLSHTQSEERRLHRCVEEVKSELEQLSASTMDLMEELQISQGLQQEQKIEMESLKKVKYIKGEAKQEMSKLRSALAALWERHLCLVQLYQQVRQELHASNARLVAMFQARHLSTNAVREDLQELQQKLVERSKAKLHHVVKEKESLMSRSAELRVTVEELEGAVMDLQSDNEQVLQETKYHVAEMGRQQDMDDEECPDIVGALHAEKAVLESTIVGLEHKVQDLRELVNTLQNQKGWSNDVESVGERPSPSGSAESVEYELSMDTSLEPEITQEAAVSLEGQTDTISNELQQQLQDYHQQVQEFELAQRDWEGEKEALEGVVLSLRRQVKEQQGLLVNNSSVEQQGLLVNNSSVEQQGLLVNNSSVEQQGLLVNNSSVEQQGLLVNNSSVEQEIIRLQQEKEQILEAWKTVEDEFVSLNISNSLAGNEKEFGMERIELLRADLHEWATVNKSNDNISMNEGCQTDEGFYLYLNKLQELEKDNSLLREQTERLIQEIEEKTSKVADAQNELETKSSEVQTIRDEKQDLMAMINERDERICELEESFNVHLLDLTTSKDNEISLLQTGQEDIVKLLEESRKECSLLKTKNNELLDVLGQKQQASEELDDRNKSLAVTVAESERYLESMKEEKDNLETMLQDKEKTNMSLAAENNSLLMEREVLQSLVEEYKDKVNVQLSQAVEMSKREEEIEALKQQVQINDERFKDLESKRTTLSCEKDNLEVELQQSNSELNNFACELKEKFSEIEMLKVENSKLSDAVQKQASACKDLEQKFADSMKEKDEIASRLGMKELQVDKLELDLREKGAQVDLLKLDIAKMSKALKEKEELIHTQIVNASSSDDTRYQQAQLLRLLEEKDQEIGALKQKDASLVELVSRTDENTHRAQEAYEGKLQQLREERERLLADLSLRDEELLNADDRLEAMREKMQGKDQASQLLHNEHARLLALNESQANEMGKLREKISLLQKLVEGRGRAKTVEEQRIQEENVQLRRQMSTLKVEHETLTTLIHEKDKQIATLAQLGSSNTPLPSPQGVELLREERDVLLRERDSVFREKDMKEKEICRLREEIYSIRQTLEEKSSLAASEVAENEQLCKQLANLQSQLSTLSTDKSNLVKSDNRIKELEDEITSCKHELKHVLEDFRNEKSLILVELESIRSERDDILEQKDVETNELKNKMLQLANSVTETGLGKQENVDDIDKNFQTLLQSIKNQRNKALRERDKEIQSLREQLSSVTLLNKAGNDRDSGLEELLRDKEELHRALLQVQDEKQDLVREKESTVADLQDQIVSLSRAVSERERASQQDLQRVIQEKERIVKELDQALRTNEEMNSASSQWQDDISKLQAELHQLRGALTEERDTIAKLHKDMDQYKMALQEKERIAKELMAEREQLVRTEEQLRARVQQLQEELSAASSGQKVAETKMAQELDRLRNHLVQVEESYTREALEAEEREKDLRMKIARAEEQLLSSSHSMLDRNRQASVQIENLQEQLQAIAVQRDRAVLDLASSQEQAHQYQTALNNLQLVLEQFQRERESQLQGAQQEAQKQVGKAWDQVRELQQRENHLKSQLQMAARVTEEVVNIRSQLKGKEEELFKHKQEVARLDEELRISQERIKSLNSMSDSKVEKFLVKNMLLTYFNTSENKRAEVVRVIGGLLGFTYEELEKVGTGSSPPTGSWISNLIPFGHSAPKTPTRITASVDKSFSELFVSFLESESEVPLSSGEGSRRSNLSNPLLSGAAHHVQQSAGRPIATSTPVGTPARTTMPSLPPSAISRPLTGPMPSVTDGLSRASLSGTNANPLLMGSLTPAQELPALSSSNSLRTLLEGRT